MLGYVSGRHKYTSRPCSVSSYVRPFGRDVAPRHSAPDRRTAREGNEVAAGRVRQFGIDAEHISGVDVRGGTGDDLRSPGDVPCPRAAVLEPTWNRPRDDRLVVGPDAGAWHRDRYVVDKGDILTAAVAEFAACCSWIGLIEIIVVDSIVGDDHISTEEYFDPATAIVVTNVAHYQNIVGKWRAAGWALRTAQCAIDDD